MSVSPSVRGRRIRIVGAAVLLLAGVAGCDGRSVMAPSQPATAAGGSAAATVFSPLTHSTAPLIRPGAGVPAYAEPEGAKLVVADSADSALRRVQQLTGWIAHGKVPAIWAIAVNANALKPVFTRARARGTVIPATGIPPAHRHLGATTAEATVSGPTQAPKRR